MAGFFSAGILDYDGEIGIVRHAATLLTAANWAAQATLRGDYLIALDGVIAGTRKNSRYGNRTVISSSPSSISVAQRELKMLVQYHDATTSIPQQPLEIPMPNLANLDADDRAHFNIGDEDVIDAFVTAFEAYVLSAAGNAVVIDELTLVGRRL